MRSCVLVLAWLGAVLFLSLRGSVKAAQTNSVRGLINPRLTRNLVVPDNSNTAGIRYTRNRGASASIGARPGESLVLLDEIESAVDEDKRQFDDYGHMRFGKRGPAFDDYGHMRFGRSD